MSDSFSLEDEVANEMDWGAGSGGAVRPFPAAGFGGVERGTNSSVRGQHGVADSVPASPV